MKVGDTINWPKDTSEQLALREKDRGFLSNRILGTDSRRNRPSGPGSIVELIYEEKPRSQQQRAVSMEEEGSAVGKIRCFWTEMQFMPKSCDTKWIIPYDLEKNKYEYDYRELPRDIRRPLDRDLFDRMMKEINEHPKISASSRRPYRKFFGWFLAVILVHSSLLCSSYLPEEALFGLVLLGFVVIMLILNYIREQIQSFGEVKRREINSILRRYECFTEKDVLVDFDVSDFGAYMTVTLIKNPRLLTYILQTDPDSGFYIYADKDTDIAKGEHNSLKIIKEHQLKLLLPSPDKQSTAAFTEGSKSQDKFDQIQRFQFGTQDLDELECPLKNSKYEGPRPENRPEYESSDKKRLISRQNIDIMWSESAKAENGF